MFKFFQKKGSSTKKEYQLKDVVAGNIITIERNDIRGKFTNVLCLNNLPKEKKIYLQITWEVTEYTLSLGKQVGNIVEHKIICKYSDDMLKNFTLINNCPNINDSEYHIAQLQRIYQTSIEQEKYEEVISIKKQLEQLITENNDDEK